MIFPIEMVNEVLELNSNSDLIFESQSLLALASGGSVSGSVSNNNSSHKKHQSVSCEENHREHQRERHFLDSETKAVVDEEIDRDSEKRSPHDKLSWTFFEEVSTLDRRLRSEATTSDRPTDSSQNDDENIAADVVALLSLRISSL